MVIAVTTSVPKSPFRWVGSKYRKAELIWVLIAPCNPVYFCEPFLGGGSVFLRGLYTGKILGGLLSDVNPFLLQTWRYLLDYKTCKYSKFERVYSHKFKEGHCAEQYSLIRDEFNVSLQNSRSWMGDRRTPTLMDCVNFYYLNRTGFNGLFRCNKQLQYNTPIGKDAKGNLLSPKIPQSVLELREVYKPLKDCVLFGCGGFEQSLDALVFTADPKQTVVYFDPPFLKESSNSDFTDYFEPFGLSEHLELCDRLDQLSALGFTWVLSSSQSQVILDRFRIQIESGSIKVHLADRRNMVSCNTRNAVAELIFIHRGQVA